jgi:DNA-binding response OmpR family regulator
VRMLLIAADAQARQTLLESASRASLLADAASGPAEATELARVWIYDVVFLDMAGTLHDRIALTQAVRRRFVRARLVLLDAWGSTAERIEALEAGADETLEKPLDAEELTARMRAMGRGEADPLTPAAVRSELVPAAWSPRGVARGRPERAARPGRPTASSATPGRPRTRTRSLAPS